MKNYEERLTMAELSEHPFILVSFWMYFIVFNVFFINMFVIGSASRAYLHQKGFDTEVTILFGSQQT